MKLDFWHSCGLYPALLFGLGILSLVCHHPTSLRPSLRRPHSPTLLPFPPTLHPFPFSSSTHTWPAHSPRPLLGAFPSTSHTMRRYARLSQAWFLPLAQINSSMLTKSLSLSLPPSLPLSLSLSLYLSVPRFPLSPLATSSPNHLLGERSPRSPTKELLYNWQCFVFCCCRSRCMCILGLGMEKRIFVGQSENFREVRRCSPTHLKRGGRGRLPQR